MKDIIQPEIFDQFPYFVRGVCILRDIHIRDTDADLADQLISISQQRHQEGKLLLESPMIVVWDEAHRKFGSNPNRFPPSISSLVDRVVRGKSLPFINAAVAAFNIVSLRHLLPCGGDNLNVIQGDAVLGLANGTEVFTPLGSDEIDHPVANEVIYFDDVTNQVMCRRWNWRNSTITKIETGRGDILVNVDALGQDSKSLVYRATREIAQLLETSCGGQARIDLLHSENRSIEI